MTFRALAFRNMVSNWHRYSAYFLSCVFSVAIFFLYAAYMNHPELIKVQGQLSEFGQQIVLICTFLIFGFSFFFVLYSSSAFVRSRQKEVGLFSLFGMSKWQLRLMFVYENVFIAVTSIAVGIGIGTILLKLFFLSMSYYMILESPLPFYFPVHAALFTAVAYLALFGLITLWTLRKVGRRQLIDLIRSDKGKDQKLRFSWLLGLLAICSLLYSYFLAWHTDLYNITSNTLPIFALAIAGTYFLYTQFSIVIVRLLKMNRRWYYNGTNLLNISRAAYRVRENARVLFNISILVAVVLTSSASVYALDRTMYQFIRTSHPFAFTMLEVHDRPFLLTLDQVETVAEQYNHKITSVKSVQMIEGTTKSISGHLESVTLVRQSDMNSVLETINGRKLPPTETGAYWIDQSTQELFQGGRTHYPDKLEVKLEGLDKPIEYNIQRKIDITLVPTRYASGDVLAVPEQHWEQLNKQVAPKLVSKVMMIDWTNWEQSYQLVKELGRLADAPNTYYLTSRIGDNYEIQQTSSLGFFIGIFISLLFFVASGSIIYFKMFNDLQEDKLYYQSLVRIGLSIQEIKRVVNVQVGIIFFLPCMIGSLHTIFAMKTLSNITNVNALSYGLTIVLIFIVMQALYFLASRKTYLRIILQGIER
ncbi:ABC transporter permease [Paenibacillus sp. SC116]|uniref:ABC transporter permease n=1 Tax=Paenibacillus sp. SC116 TaxID=2968986 RepID=UPI00215AD3C4|nr:ABC transporter permease [Paenibacillus sp. SC116]MCR8843220.1 ABC transporter permease [Paenibacillus sp. SC116]